MKQTDKQFKKAIEQAFTQEPTDTHALQQRIMKQLPKRKKPQYKFVWMLLALLPTVLSIFIIVKYRITLTECTNTFIYNITTMQIPDGETTATLIAIISMIVIAMIHGNELFAIYYESKNRDIRCNIKQ